MSNNVYTPDRWVIIKFVTKKEGTFYKVLGGWSGGFTTSDSWRMNSGIEGAIKINYDGRDAWNFVGYSGSTYQCRVDAEGCNGIMHQILEQLMELNIENEVEISVIPVEQLIEELNERSEDA